MNKQASSFSLALLATGLVAASANAQLTLNDTYSIRSDRNNGSLSQRWERTEMGPPAISGPSGVYGYAIVPASGGNQGTIPLRADGSNPPTGETGLGRRFNNVIFYFELPELGEGLSVGNANLAFTLKSLASGGAGTGNGDLWGLGFTDSTEYFITGTDIDDRRANFWHATDTDSRPGIGVSQVSKIQDNILQFDGTYTNSQQIATDAEGSAALGVFLNSLYTAGAQAGDYAAFRLTYDEVYDPTTAGFLGYSIAGSLADAAGTDPTLSFTAIPEPSTVALISGFAALTVAGLIRRRSRS